MSRREVAVVAALFFLVTLGPFFLGLGALLFIAETWEGRGCGLLGLGAIACLAVLVRFGYSGRPRGAIVAVIATCWFALAVGLGVHAPDPRATSKQEPAVASVFLKNDDVPRRKLADWLPEIDQVKAGTYAAGLMDPFLDMREAASVRERAMQIYREMDSDPRWRAVPSTMSWAYADADAGHLYVMVPPHAPDERLPAIVFLHGSVGNFKMYLPFWERFAREHRFVVVAPSFGFGYWNAREGVDVSERARRYAIDHLPVREGEIFLAGLSNGGLGITRGAEKNADAYAGFIYLSAVVEPKRMQEQQQIWKGRKVLLVHGERDDRVAIADVRKAASVLEGAGANVTFRSSAGGDHFLFITDATLFDDIAAWITR